MPRSRMRAIARRRSSDARPLPRADPWVATLPIPPSSTRSPRRRIARSKICTHETGRPSSSASRRSPYEKAASKSM